METTIREFTKEQAIEYLKSIGKRSKVFFNNVYGWSRYLTLEPTIATPTGKDKDFPRTVRVTVPYEVKGIQPIRKGQKVVAIAEVWHNLVKEGATGEVVKVMENGFNVYFPLSNHYTYQDQIFFCTPEQIKAI